jgi:uncharacterized membrane protein
VAVGWLVAGNAGAQAALLFGAIATGIQLLAARLARRIGIAASIDQLRVYAIGTVLRFAGVGMIGVVALTAGEGFSFSGAALGYVGVILPLLYLETRLGR